MRCLRPAITPREEAMVTVLEAMAQRHNEMGVTAAVDPACCPFDVGLPAAARPLTARRAPPEKASESRRYTLGAVCDGVKVTQVTSLPHRPIYTYPQVDRLLGVTSGTARRWVNGYQRGRRAYEPIIRWTSDGSAAATILTTDPDTLWRLCVRGIEPHNARQRVTVRGNTELADAALQIVSITR
jgi:hypothetical protein